MIPKNIKIVLLPNIYTRKNLLRNYSISISEVLQKGKIGDKISIKGWIKSLRKQKENIFLDLNDGSTEKKLQVILSSNLLKDKISTGASVNVAGTLSTAPKGQIELHANKVELYGHCLIADGYPFAPKKRYSSEYIRQYLHFRPRTHKFSSLLRVRSAAVSAIHEYFKSENYIQIHTPIITSNDCEGAGEVFKVIPNSNELLNSMVSDDIPLEESFFNKKILLTASGQLHLEAAVHGLSKVYSFGPTFRAENSKSRLHLSEFYMLEAEVAFIDRLEELLVPVEKLIKSITRTILDTSESDIINCQIDNTSLSWLDQKFAVLTFNEAEDILKNNVDKFQKQYDLENGFSKEQELFLVKYLGNVPVFVIEWPKSLKPFYMKECSDDNLKVLAFDLLVPNVGELVGGSLRENNFGKLQEQIPKNNGHLDWYLELRKYGSVPTGGYGLGFDRYLMFLLGIENIKDVIPFPRWPHNCSM